MIAGYAIDEARWAKMDIFNQMGNIYSEVGRTFKARRQLKSEDSLQAISRAIDLFDASIHILITEKSPKAREILRAKEQFLSLAFDADATCESILSLDRYFMQYAIAARLKHDRQSSH